MDAIWALVGAVIGGAAVWLLMRGRVPDQSNSAEQQKRIEELLSDKAKAESEAASRQQRVQQLEDELAGTHSDLIQSQSDFHKLDIEHASLKSDIDAREQAFEDRIREMKNLEERFKDTFENLSNEALKKSSDELIKQSKLVLDRYRETDDELAKSKNQEIEKLLQPVQSELKRLEEFNRVIEQERLKETTSLKDQLTILTSGTGKLISALQGSGSAGRWGEVQLQRIVEMAGLQENLNYEIQKSLGEGEGRPDMQILLPGGKRIFVDSKVPIQDLEHIEAMDEAGRKALSVGISNKVMDYAKGLNKRDYAKKEDSPDFVVMFIASESAFRMAVEGKPGLFEDAMNMNVMIASPSTLLPMLKAVHYGWRQERLASEAQNIMDWAKELYNALVTMKGHYDDLGKRIEAVGRKYNDFGGSLDRSVLPKARKMRDAGLPVKDEISETTGVVEFSQKQLRAPDYINTPEEAQQLSLDQN